MRIISNFEFLTVDHVFYTLLWLVYVFDDFIRFAFLLLTCYLTNTLAVITMETNFNSYEEVGSELRSLESLHSTEPDASFTSHFQNTFKPVKILGQGGFGCVFEAEKHVMGKLTLWRGAVKRIP
ncbi:hypothetical protein PRIPAC_90401, partial [Pristionchus pacificus]